MQGQRHENLVKLGVAVNDDGYGMSCTVTRMPSLV